jgi:predicted ferric reductase
VALYLGLAVGISTWLRPRIGYTWWRRLHVLTFGVYVLATLHGLGTGSDTQTWWGLSIYLVSIVLVGSLLCQRLLARANKRKHAPAHPGVPRRVLPLPSTSPPR